MPAKGRPPPLKGRPRVGGGGGGWNCGAAGWNPPCCCGGGGGGGWMGRAGAAGAGAGAAGRGGLRPAAGLPPSSERHWTRQEVSASTAVRPCCEASCWQLVTRTL